MGGGWDAHAYVFPGLSDETSATVDGNSSH